MLKAKQLSSKSSEMIHDSSTVGGDSNSAPLQRHTKVHKFYLCIIIVLAGSYEANCHDDSANHEFNAT